MGSTVLCLRRMIWGVTTNELCFRTGMGVGEESVKVRGFNRAAQSTAGSVFDRTPYLAENLMQPPWVTVRVLGGK